MINVDGLVQQILFDLGCVQSGSIVPLSTTAGFQTQTELKSVVTPTFSPLKSESELQSEPKSESGLGELRLQTRVVTLADLQDQLSNLRRLIVPEKAIITPSVRDELRKRNIELGFYQSLKPSQVAQSIQPEIASSLTAGASHKKEKPPLRVWLGLHLIKQEPSGLFEFLQKQYVISRQFYKCILEVMKEAESELVRELNGCLGIVLTQHSALAMCAGNRRGAIRAVLGTEVDLLQKDAREVGANLLILDPTRLNPYKTRELVKAFLNEGSNSGPEYL